MKKSEIFLIALIVIFCAVFISTNIIINNDNGNNNTNINNNTNTNNNIPILRVNDTDIIDVNGEKLVLKAILIEYNNRDMINGTYNRSYLAEDSWFTEEKISDLKELNLNTIDIHGISLVRVTDDDGEINEEYFVNMVDKWVEWCSNNGFYCVLNIDAFGIHNPKKYGSYRMPYWLYDEYGSKPYNLTYQARILHDFWDIETESMDDERAIFIKIWTYIANRYLNETHVMFALYNEPLHHTWENSTNARMQYLGKSYSIIITDIIDGIRSNGSKHIIFVDRPYVYDFDKYKWTIFIKPVNRTNIVWEYHVYISNYHNLEEWKEQIEDFEKLFKTEFGKPTYLGEWGMDPPRIIRNLKDWIGDTRKQVSFLDEKNISWSYTAWGRLYGQANWAHRGTEDYLSKTEREILIEIVLK